MTQEIIEAEVVKSEIVSYIGNSIDQAQSLALAVRDDASAEQATNLGVSIKTKLIWLKDKREEIYTPLFRAAERIRLEFDQPIKIATQIEKTLSAAVIKYRLDKKREEERLRLAAEAEARRIREDAERKEREAEAERLRIIKEQENRERKRKDEEAAEEHRKQAEIEARKKAEQERLQKEQDERIRLLREEEDERLKKALEAHDVGLEERSDAILERPTAIASIAKPLPSQIEIQAENDRKAKEKEAENEMERRRLVAKAEEDRLCDEEAAKVRKLQEDAERAKADADAAESMVAAQITVSGMDNRIRTNGSWAYSINNEADFMKLVRAVAGGVVPVSWLGFDPERPEKFRAAPIQKHVTKFRNDPYASRKQAELAAVGITTWLEESGIFKVEKEDA